MSVQTPPMKPIEMIAQGLQCLVHVARAKSRSA